MNLFTVVLLAVLLVLGMALVLRKRFGFWKTCAVLAALLLVSAAITGLRNQVSYETPQQAFESFHLSREGEPMVLVGKESALVTVYRDGKELLALVEKTEKGWKRGSQMTVETQTYFIGEKTFAIVYHKKGTGDYYLMLAFWPEGPHTVCDSCGSEFQTVTHGGMTQVSAWIRVWSEDYTLTVDGANYVLKDCVDPPG